LVRRFYEQIDKGNIDVLDELVADDVLPADALIGNHRYDALTSIPCRTAIALSPEGRLGVFCGSKGDERQL
jgi:hypothetical protein